MDLSANGCDPERALMCFALQAWELANKQGKQKAEGHPPGQSMKIQQLLQDLETELELARHQVSQ